MSDYYDCCGVDADARSTTSAERTAYRKDGLDTRERRGQGRARQAQQGVERALRSRTSAVATTTHARARARLDDDDEDDGDATKDRTPVRRRSGSRPATPQRHGSRDGRASGCRSRRSRCPPGTTFAEPKQRMHRDGDRPRVLIVICSSAAVPRRSRARQVAEPRVRPTASTRLDDQINAATNDAKKGNADATTPATTKDERRPQARGDQKTSDALQEADPTTDRTIRRRS